MRKIQQSKLKNAIGAGRGGIEAQSNPNVNGINLLKHRIFHVPPIPGKAQGKISEWAVQVEQAGPGITFATI